MAEIIWDTAVLGGGAAGLICAAEAAKRGRKVAVFESQERLGKKLLISGGGRCNFTHLNTTVANFFSENPAFAASALARFRPEDFVALVSKEGIAFHEKTPGQLFCDLSSKQIVSMLEKLCLDAGVVFFMKTKINEVRKDDVFVITTSTEKIRAHRCVVATGGLSYPILGATPIGYRIAESFGHNVIPTRPALVPFLWESQNRVLTNLAGVSLPVRMSVGKTIFEDDLLFTHEGISGPAVLQVSTAWKPGTSVKIDFLPRNPFEKIVENARRTTPQKEISKVLAMVMPARLAEALCSHYGATTAVHQVRREVLDALNQALHAWTFVPRDTAGYTKAEVTRGGVDTHQLSSKTMESTLVPGLFFVGEVVDVTGWLGGYNCQWAWSSGWAAGQAQ